jgi:antitoxin ParD1/3/4
MNISLSADLRDYVNAQVAELSYSSTSEFVRHLIRQDRDAGGLRAALLAGLASPTVGQTPGQVLDQVEQDLGLVGE